MSDEQKTAEEIAAAEDEVVITIGEDTPPQEDEKEAPPWVKEVRKNNRQLTKDNRNLKEQLAKATSTGDKSVELGVKPSLESCGFDEGKYETELTSYHSRKTEISNKEEAVAAKLKAADEDWQKQLNGHGEKITALNAKDFAEIESDVQAILSVEQQGIIIGVAENSANVIYALGKNPEVLKKLAEEKNPAKFIASMVRLETQLKVTKRKPASAPETTLKGSTHVVDSNVHLEQLRKEAKETNDYTKVTQYKKQLRDAEK